MSSETDPAVAIAEAYLAAMEARDLELARSFVTQGDLDLVFPGGRHFTRIEDIVANSGGRYAKIGKTITRRNAWSEGTVTHVLIAGALHGVWPDGTDFDGIRFIDLFALQDGLITRQEVWNDAGERLLQLQKAEGTQ